MTDQEILRTLALEYREIAESPENGERRERAYKINALQAVRPIVWIHEIPWSEFDKCEELRPVCSDAFARGMETRLRRTIYQWKHFPADMIVENEFTVSKAYDVSPIGIRVQERRLATDERNYIVSHKYVDQLDTPEKVLALKCPVITPRPDTDAQNIEKAEALLGGILPVRLRGSFFGSAVWDDIATYRGMTNLLTDLACDEELMHLTAKRMYEIKTACAVQMSGHGLFSSFVSDLHCTPGYSHALENSGADGTSGGTWLRAMAQPFASVSPKMHDEFDIQYLIPLAERFAYVYYGCCEQLSDRLDVIKKIPNLRKVGVSPWSDAEASAEQLGNNYVFSRKPNPAFVQGTFDADAVYRETEKTVKACVKYGCPCDFSLKDISSVGGKPENLALWADTVRSVLNQYY